MLSAVAFLYATIRDLNSPEDGMEEECAGVEEGEGEDDLALTSPCGSQSGCDSAGTGDKAAGYVPAASTPTLPRPVAQSPPPPYTIHGGCVTYWLTWLTLPCAAVRWLRRCIATPSPRGGKVPSRSDSTVELSTPLHGSLHCESWS
jgi:hypothetical protein